MGFCSLSFCMVAVFPISSVLLFIQLISDCWLLLQGCCLLLQDSYFPTIPRVCCFLGILLGCYYFLSFNGIAVFRASQVFVGFFFKFSASQLWQFSSWLLTLFLPVCCVHNFYQIPFSSAFTGTASYRVLYTHLLCYVSAQLLVIELLFVARYLHILGEWISRPVEPVSSSQTFTRGSSQGRDYRGKLSGTFLQTLFWRKNTCRSFLFLPETYLSHVSESCWFVNCHVSRAG